MKIRDKLLLAFIVIILAIGMAGYVEQRHIRKVTTTFKQLESRKIPSLTTLLEITAVTRRASIKAMEYASRGHIKDREKALEALAELDQELQRFIALNPDDTAAAKKLVASKEYFATLLHNYLKMAEGPAIENVFRLEEALHKSRSILIRHLDSTMQQASGQVLYSLLLAKSEARKLSLKLIEYALRGNAADRDEALKAVDELQTILQEPVTADTRHPPFSKQLQQEVQDYLTSARHYLQQISLRRYAVRQIYASEDKLHAARRALIHTLYPMINSQYEALANAASATSSQMERAGRLLVYGVGLAAVVAILAGLILARSLSTPLTRLATLMDRFGRGESISPDEIPTRGSLEQRQLGQAIAGMIKEREMLSSSLKQQILALRKAERKLAEAQRIAQIGNWELDLQANELWWSDEIFRIFEIDQKRFSATYEGFLNAIHPDDREKVNSAYTESLKTREPYDIVHRLKMSDGRIKYVHERCESEFDKKGRALRSAGTVQDITAHYRTRQALEESEKRLTLLLNTLPHGIQENDTEGRITYSNLAQHRILGYEPGELVGRYIWDFQTDEKHKQELREYLAYLIDKQPTPESYITHNRNKDGRELVLEVTWDYQRDAAGNITGFISIISEITARAEAERALKTSEARLKEAQTLAHLGNWDLNLKTGKASWSEEEYRLLGYEPGEVEACAEQFMNAVHPEDREKVQAEMQRSMQPGEKKPYHIQHRVLLSNGSVRVVEERGQVTFDAQGNPQHMFGTTQDITKRVQYEKELALYQEHLEQLVEERTTTVRQQAQIIDQTHDAVVTTDLDGYITSWNGGAEQLFTIPENKAKGQHISIVYPEKQKKTLENDIIVPLKKKGTHEIEVTLKKADGTEFPVHLSLSLLYDDEGKPVGMAGYSIDISELKKREAELQQMAEQLLASNRELEAFSYSVSHDLRAPLRAIDGFSLALLEDYGNQLDDTAHDYLNRVRNGAQRLGILIDEILQLSRVNRSELVLENVDLAELARSVFEEIREGDTERQVEFVLEDDLQVQGDARLLRLMLENLIGNAWKFTAREEKARISFGRMREDPEILYIQDNGVGFNMNHAGKLFGAFQRLHRLTDFPGTGVGLATVQRIIHRHGGKIWANAEEGVGATFYFTLSKAGQIPIQ